MSFANAIQAAIYTRLAAYTALTSVVVGIYDEVPQATDSGANSTYPYVTIGEDSITADSQDDAVGCQGSIVIHTWSRLKGRKQIKTIQGLIFDALSRHELSVTGYSMLTLEWDGEDSFIDADGVTRHGVSTFRILLA